MIGYKAIKRNGENKYGDTFEVEKTISVICQLAMANLE